MGDRRPVEVYEEVGLDEEDGWVVLALAGDLDVVGAPQFRRRVVELVADGRSRIVVDLRGITFLDSMGLGALVGALKRARAHGGDLRVRGLAGHVAEVLALTGLDAVLTGDPTAVTE